MITIGIDPGLDGAIGVIDERGRPSFDITPTVECAGAKGNKREYDIPMMARLLRDLSSSHDDCHAYLEQQQAFPDQGGVSNFSTGKGYGIWLGLLTALQIPFTTVHPRTWSTAMLRDMPKGDRKSVGAIVAGRLFPMLDLRASDRCRKPHEGAVDALLIATWGWRQRNGAQ